MAESAFDRRYREGQERVAQQKIADEAEANQPYVYKSKAQRQVDYKVDNANQARQELEQKRELSSDPYRTIEGAPNYHPRGFTGGAGPNPSSSAASTSTPRPPVINTSLPYGTPGGPGGVPRGESPGGANGAASGNNSATPRTGGPSRRGQMQSGAASGGMLANSIAQNNGGGQYGGGLTNLSYPGQAPGYSPQNDWANGGAVGLLSPMTGGQGQGQAPGGQGQSPGGSGEYIDGAQAHGSAPVGVARPNEAVATGYNSAGYNAPGQAQTSGYNVEQQTIDPRHTSAGMLASMTSGNSPYIEAARTNALQTMNRTGNLNTSTAVGAAELAAIRAAQPFAINDSGQHFNADRDYANSQNREGEFEAGAGNQASMQTNRQQDQAFRFGADAENAEGRHNAGALNNTSQYNAGNINRAREFNASAINRAGELYANAQNAASIQDANNNLRLALAGMDDDLSRYGTDQDRAYRQDILAADLFQTGLSSGVFNNPETAAGYFRTIASMIPSLGIQVVADSADSVPDGVIQ